MTERHESESLVEKRLTDAHLLAFVERFVSTHRKERWRYLLTERPKKLYDVSHTLENDIDHRYCRLVSELQPFATNNSGIFFNFRDEAAWLTGKAALAEGQNQDAIFSVVEGKEALFFSHEGRTWHCKTK